jgi:serine protease inhibitor
MIYQPEEPKIVRADRPFLFIIKASSSLPEGEKTIPTGDNDTILFIGRIVKPVYN